MQDRALYSIHEARKLLGGISRNGIYALLRTGELASVVIGCRRFISDAAIAALISKATTTVSEVRWVRLHERRSRDTDDSLRTGPDLRVQYESPSGEHRAQRHDHDPQ
jgi:hypothetical protein